MHETERRTIIEFLRTNDPEEYGPELNGMSLADLLKHQESCVERYYEINREESFRRILESV